MRTSGTNISATGHKAGLGNVLYDKAGARPDLDLDFARTKSLKDRISKEDLITFTRSTTASGSHNGATYVDEKGYINRAGFNLVKYSQDFSQSDWTKNTSTFTGNNIVAPDGTLTAGTWSEDSTGFGVSAGGTNAWIIDPTSSGSSAGDGAWDNYLDQFTDWVRLRSLTITVPSNANGNVNIFPVFSGSGSIVQTVPAFAGEQYVLSFWIKKVGTKVYVWGVQFEPASNFPADSLTYIDDHLLKHKFHSEYVKTTTQPNSAPRFTHDPVTKESKGLLIEQEATNTLLYSEDISQTNWVKVNVRLENLSTKTSPAGDQTAYFIAPNGNGSYSRIYQEQSFDGNAATYSVFAKADGYRYLHLRIGSGSTNIGHGFDLQNGVAIAGVYDGTNSMTATSHSIENYGNGWYRCCVTGSIASGTRYVFGYVSASATTTDSFPITDGSAGILLWGWQKEAGDVLTSYIPTSGSTATRSPDLTTIDGDNFGTYRTNLVTNTSFRKNFDGYTKFTNTRYKAYAAISPSGKFDAAKLTAISTGSNTNHRLDKSLSLQGNVKYSVSVYVKAGTTSHGRVAFQYQSNPTGLYSIVDFNLATPSITFSTSTNSNASLTHVGNDWYLLKYTTATTVASPSGDKVILHVSDSTGNISFDGNGESMFMWGLQVERADAPTEFIPSTDEFTSRSNPTATYVDRTGLIKTASANEARYSHDPITLTPTGLYLEPASTNYLKSSSNFNLALSNGGWAHATSDNPRFSFDNNIANPDGSMGAAYLNNNGIETYSYFDTTQYDADNDGSPDGTDTVTISCFVKAKANETDEFILQLYLGQGAVTINLGWVLRFDPNANNGEGSLDMRNPQRTVDGSTVTLGTSSNPIIKKYQNGWFRIGCTVQVNPVTEGGVTYSTFQNNARLDIQSGTNNNDGNDGKHYFWGPQVEVGDNLTSYIPTSGSEGTRSADIFTSTATEVLDRANGTKPAFFTKNGLSIFAVGQLNTPNGESHRLNRVFQLHADGLEFRITGDNSEKLKIENDDDINGGAKTFTAGSFRGAARYELNNTRLAVNGAIGTHFTSNSVIACTALSIGKSSSNGSLLNGTMNRLTFWKTSFVDSKLKRLTS